MEERLDERSDREYHADSDAVGSSSNPRDDAQPDDSEMEDAHTHDAVRACSAACPVGNWQDIKTYLLTGGYPSSILLKEKRNFRKKALKYVVQENKLFFKKHGCLRAVLRTREEQKQAFQVCM